ncbi:MAG: LacI family DNA-binding transcriptional regulator [Deltaproteobacteria bacterium]|nr:LacI family DNA-binding transcriptional regulator [Deltaproteobacteria bacterium]
MSITISEIARLTGVSTATVSRVLNDSTLVKPKTKHKVLRALKEHDYVYNAVAGGLTKRRTSTIGLIIPTITNPVFSLSTKGIHEAARERGYSMLLGSTDYSYDKEFELIKLFHEKRVDGIIFTGAPGNSKSLEFMKRLRIPYLITFELVQDDNVSFVSFDNIKSGKMTTDYLISLGHRRIAMISGLFNETSRAYNRWLGYRQSLVNHGITYDESLVMQREYTTAAGKQAMEKLLRNTPPPTAVFCGNDIIASGAIAAVKEAGYQVGKDISIAGFDDLEMCEAIEPALTSIRIPGYEMGSQGAQALIDIIEGKLEAPCHCVLDSELIKRKSTGPAPECRN